MLLLSKIQVNLVIYVTNSKYEVMKEDKDEGYYTVYLSESINKKYCKYLIWKKQLSSNQTILIFFLIHDIDIVESNSNKYKYKLFIQKYVEISHLQSIKFFLQTFHLVNVQETSIIDLHQLEIQNIFDTNFTPFVTAIPVKYRIIDIKHPEIIIQKISDKFRNNFLHNINLEFKNTQSIILNNKSITDNNNKFIVKKGIEYSVEFINSDTIWINLSCTNFSRTVDSVNKLELEEPIDRYQHRLVNIKTGRSIPKKVISVSDIKEPKYVFETFDSSESFSERYENIRFSQEKDRFEQTNLQETMSFIYDLAQNSNNNSNIICFENINKINYRYKIIHRKRKYLFAHGDLHYTAPKGLNNSGVFKMPERLKIKLVVSTQQIKIEPLSKIINNINDRLIFLYKNFVPPISDADVIIFDYNNFIYDSLESQLSNEDYSYILHLFDIKDIQFKNQSERENINSINKYLVEIVKKHRLAFVVLNSFNVYVIANSLLKLGLKSKAIPWKIKDVDSEDPQHIFIGIDLGHNHRNKSSNLTIAVIDNFGCLLQKRTWKNLKADEVISYENLLEGFNWILTKLSKPIDRITIHRDGLITQNELEYFHQVMEKVKIENYNLVEVIKSGSPRIGFRSSFDNRTEYLDGFMGYFVFTNDLSYLITNDQSLRNKKTVPNPLKIKKRYGYKKISTLTEEIYWLTKAYSINIFEPTYLPITTLLANNSSYSKELLHFTTE
jgi:hypothetical protein